VSKKDKQAPIQLPCNPQQEQVDNTVMSQIDAAQPVETAPAPRIPGTAKGDFVVPDDFSEPLPDDVIAQFEGKLG
jgi:hypothetical protein